MIRPVNIPAKGSVPRGLRAPCLLGPMRHVQMKVPGLYGSSEDRRAPGGNPWIADRQPPGNGSQCEGQPRASWGLRCLTKVAFPRQRGVIQLTTTEVQERLKSNRPGRSTVRKFAVLGARGRRSRGADLGKRIPWSNRPEQFSWQRGREIHRQIKSWMSCSSIAYL